MRLLRSYRSFASSLARGLSEQRAFFLLLTSTLYLLGAMGLARWKLLWFDEIFTVYLARLPSFGDAWRALRAGADLTPPLFQLMTRASTALFGADALGARLPGIAGFLVMNLCLFRFLARRRPALASGAAVLFVFLSGAEELAREARPYGLMLGCCGLALLLWQQAADERSRRASFLGLATSAAAAVSLHYYAALALAPIGFGEIARSVQRKRVDWRMWLALSGAAAVLAFHLPFIQGARTYATSRWYAPSVFDIPELYATLLKPAVLPLAAALILVGVLAGSGARREEDSEETRVEWPAHEIVAGAGLAALPLLGVLTAATVTGMLAQRYLMPSVLGLAILLAALMSKSRLGRPELGAMIFLVLFGCFFATAFLRMLLLLGPPGKAETRDMLLTAGEPELPIVVQDPRLYLPLQYYAPAPLASRLRYVADVALANRYTGSDSPDRGLLALRHWAPLRVEEWSGFVRSNKRFLLYWQPSNFGWLISHLAKEGANIELKRQDGNEFLFFVDLGR